MNTHEEVAKEYLEENYNVVFDGFMQVIDCEVYVTQRQFLNLLGRLLLEKMNFKVMVKYVAEKKHLQQIMTLMKCNSAAIRYYQIYNDVEWGF